RVAYRVKHGNKFVAVIDGRNGNEYDFVSQPVFSADGKQYAYAARNTTTWIIVLNENLVTIEPNSEITAIYFSPDGKYYDYILKKVDKYNFVHNGSKGKEYDAIDENSVTFSGDNKTVAYS